MLFRSIHSMKSVFSHVFCSLNQSILLKSFEQRMCACLQLIYVFPSAFTLCGCVERLPSGNCVLPSSTGVIGWRLPVDEMVAALPALEDLSSSPALEAAKGIMTTDRYPKLAARELANGARLVGIAKGAGMIEPNMATMLCFLMTDAKLSPDEMQQFLWRRFRRVSMPFLWMVTNLPVILGDSLRATRGCCFCFDIPSGNLT